MDSSSDEWNAIRQCLEEDNNRTRINNDGIRSRNNGNDDRAATMTMTPTAIGEAHGQQGPAARPQPPPQSQRYRRRITSDTMAMINKDTTGPPAVIEVKSKASRNGGVQGQQHDVESGGGSHYSVSASSSSAAAQTATSSRPGAYAIRGVDGENEEYEHQSSEEHKSRSSNSDEGKEQSSQGSSSRSKGEDTRRRRRVFLLVGGSVLIAVIIEVVVIIVLVTKGNSDDVDNNRATALYDQLRGELQGLSGSLQQSQAPLSTDNTQSSVSPQEQAIRWLVNEDKYFGWNVNTTKSILVPNTYGDDGADLGEDSDSTVVTVSRKQLYQRYGLLVLYFATNGLIDWIDISFINPNEHVCKWAIVGQPVVWCDDADSPQSITRIDLSSTGLRGSIPDEALNGLDPMYLNGLLLNDNHLDGTIPTSMGLLTKLTRLDLSQNNLNGTLPQISLSNLKELEVVRLGHNNLRGGIRAFLGDLRKLYEFNVTHNRGFNDTPLEFYTPTIGVQHYRPKQALQILHILDLSSCGFAGRIDIHIKTYELSNLRIFKIDDNKFGGDLQQSQLVTSLPSIEEFVVGNNAFFGTMPTEIGNMSPSALRVLDVSENSLTGTIPTEISHLTNLEKLSLHENRLQGTIPSEELASNLLNLSKFMLLFAADTIFANC